MRPRTRHAYPILLILGISLGFLGLAACGSGPKPSPEPVAVQPPPAKPDLSALIGAKDAAGIKDFFKNRELLDTPDSEGYYPPPPGRPPGRLGHSRAPDRPGRQA